MRTERQPINTREFLDSRSFKIASAVVGLPLLALANWACSGARHETPDDGYTNRAVAHAVENPLNGDKYTSFEFRDRVTQAKSQIDFHHLKSNPEKFERLVTTIEGVEKTVLEMQQEDVDLDRIQFQHSTINLEDTKTGQEDVLQINRVKPAKDSAEPVTAYSLFLGADAPEHIGTIILSDRQQKDGGRGEYFVSLKAGTFDFEGTSEQHASRYIIEVNNLLEELKAKDFQDERVIQATWVSKDKDRIRTTNGVLNGTRYSIVSQRGADDLPGFNKYGKNFKELQILSGNDSEIAQVTAQRFDGPGDGKAVIYKLNAIENGNKKTVLEVKRVYRDKSETQTSHGTGTTVGFTSGGHLTVGWTEIDLQTQVNFQNENTFLYSSGLRESNLTSADKEENQKIAMAIFCLLGGESILDGLNFQDSEMEWRQSSDMIIDGVQTKTINPDMGFWLELPIDSTITAQKEALKLLKRLQ